MVSESMFIMVTEDKSMVATDGEETVVKVRRRGCSILTIYEHALELYTKLSSHTVKLRNTPKRRTCSKQVKKTVSQYRKYCGTVINARFAQVSIKSKISKQFMYNWLQLVKIFSNFYEKKLKQRRKTPP